jgi:hypothetical protein
MLGEHSILNQEIYSTFLYFCLLGSLALFYSLVIIYIISIIVTFASLDSIEKKELDKKEYEYELVDNMINKYGLISIILLFPIYLLLGLTKLYGLFHINHLSRETNKVYFLSLSSHLLYYNTMLQILFLTIPHIFFQSINNLFLEEDIHDIHARGIFNMSNITGVLYVMVHFGITIISSNTKFIEWNEKNNKKGSNFIEL